MNQTFVALLLFLSAWVSIPSAFSGELREGRLLIHNTFKTPEEVVAYYCARDASGFVWSGLLDSERTEFTLWTDVPHQDSFFIARRFTVMPGTAKSPDGSLAQVQVHYTLLGVGDAHGTRSPIAKPDRIVTFELKKQGAIWKIVKPDYSEIPPVVLDSKFPAAVQ